MKPQLNNVTLMAVSSIKIKETLLALNNCANLVDFHDVKIVTHETPSIISSNIKVEICPKLDTINKYNEYVFMELERHCETDFALVIQYDSGIIHPELWSDSFLEWDFGGAVWPVVDGAYMANNGERARVGNGGFSIRSRKLLGAPKKLGLYLTQEQGFFNEDGNITCYWRTQMLNYGIKYMPIELAAIFSYENPVPENNFGQMKTFGWHKNYPYWQL